MQSFEIRVPDAPHQQLIKAANQHDLKRGAIAIRAIAQSLSNENKQKPPSASGN